MLRGLPSQSLNHISCQKFDKPFFERIIPLMSIEAADLKKLVKIVKQYEVIYGGGISTSDAAVREECESLVARLETELGPSPRGKRGARAAESLPSLVEVKKAKREEKPVRPLRSRANELAGLAALGEAIAAHPKPNLPLPTKAARTRASAGQGSAGKGASVQTAGKPAGGKPAGKVARAAQKGKTGGRHQPLRKDEAERGSRRTTRCPRTSSLFPSSAAQTRERPGPRPNVPTASPVPRVRPKNRHRRTPKTLCRSASFRRVQAE